MEITKGVNVLAIGSDMKILDEGSDANTRMKEYGTLANRLDIAIYNGSIFGRNEDQAFAVSNNVFAYPRSFLGLLSLFKIGSKKLSFVLNHRIDLITTQDPFYFGYIGWRLSRWLRASFQVQVHTDIFSPYFKKESLKNRFKVLLAKRILKRADGIRVVSNRIRDSLKREISLKVEPFVLPVWVPINSIKNSPVTIDLKKRYPQFENIILMASRITVEKNIKMVIIAMKNITKKFNKTGLVIVGEGPLKIYLKSLVHSLNLEKNVIFEDWVKNPSSYFKTADLFLNTSNYEGYGRTIVEAMVSGTPVITTDVGCAQDIIKSGENGFIIPVNGRKELEISLAEFLGNSALKIKIKKGASEYISGFKSKDDYLEMYGRSWSECLR